MPTHWKKLTNPNYLGAYALDNGQDIVLTIKKVQEETVVGTDGKKENCVVCHFSENVKPMILNSTNMKMITKLYKTPYIEEWSGKKIQIGIEKVKAFGDITEALRVRKIIPKVQTASTTNSPKCQKCGNIISPAGGMTADKVAEYTTNKYGITLCSICAHKLQEEMKNNATQ